MLRKKHKAQNTGQKVSQDQGGKGCPGSEPGEQVSVGTLTGAQNTFIVVAE